LGKLVERVIALCVFGIPNFVPKADGYLVIFQVFLYAGGALVIVLLGMKGAIEYFTGAKRQTGHTVLLWGIYGYYIMDYHACQILL